MTTHLTLANALRILSVDSAQKSNSGHPGAPTGMAKLQLNPSKIASRKASQKAIEAFGPWLPESLSGSADPAPSNHTLWSRSKPIGGDTAGNYIHYGVREFGMTVIANMSTWRPCDQVESAVSRKQKHFINALISTGIDTCPLIINH